MVYDRNRVYCWRYLGLTGIERPVYDIAISFGCPRSLRPAEMGNPGLYQIVGQQELADRDFAKAEELGYNP